MAREDLCRRAPSRQVQDVHADQSYERGLTQPTGGAVLQTRDRAPFKLPEAEEDLENITCGRLQTLSGRHPSLLLFVCLFFANTRKQWLHQLMSALTAQNVGLRFMILCTVLN